MKTRQACSLARLHARPDRIIQANSPELRFMNAVCFGDTEEAVACFRERKLFGHAPSAGDAPYGRFEGLSGIRAFAEGWHAAFHAQGASVQPVIQTRANGRSITEAVIRFVVDGEINEVPMFIVGDLRTADTLDEVRLYCHCAYVPGQTAYRKPLFRSAHLEMGDPGLLSGAMREYYEALHHVPGTDVDRIMGVMGEGCLFGGYEPAGEAAGAAQEDHGREALRRKFEGMNRYIPRCVGMRYETLTDDNTTAIIEWVHIVSRQGQQEMARIAISGISAYERGPDGLLCAIRICDYAGLERTIDWTKTPVSQEEAMRINLVDTFPAGVGRNPQS